jgi:hypothetical protein
VSHPEQEPLSAAVASQLEAVVAAAERAAEEFRRHVETAAIQQAEETRRAAEADARRIRLQAATWAAEYLEDSKRVVDEFTAERIARIGRLTDELIQGAEAVQRRFTDAQNVRRQIYDLISSLGAIAEAIALEAQMAAPELPVPPVDVLADDPAPDRAPEMPEGARPKA